MALALLVRVCHGFYKGGARKTRRKKGDWAARLKMKRSGDGLVQTAQQLVLTRRMIGVM
jgi:hypothetical protein